MSKTFYHEISRTYYQQMGFEVKLLMCIANVGGKIYHFCVLVAKKKKNGTFFLWFDRRIQIALSYVDDTFGCGYDPKAQVLIKS